MVREISNNSHTHRLLFVQKLQNTQRELTWFRVGKYNGIQNWVRLAENWIICDFLRSLFGQNVLKLILKSPSFVPFGANLTQFGAKPNIPEE